MKPKVRPVAIFRQIEKIGDYFADRTSSFDAGVLLDAEFKLKEAQRLVHIRYLDLMFDEEISA
jgi:hypothetical protein